MSEGRNEVRATVDVKTGERLDNKTEDSDKSETTKKTSKTSSKRKAGEIKDESDKNIVTVPNGAAPTDGDDTTTDADTDAGTRNADTGVEVVDPNSPS